mgnify:CR=1
MIHSIASVAMWYMRNLGGTVQGIWFGSRLKQIVEGVDGMLDGVRVATAHEENTRCPTVQKWEH